MPNYNYIIMHRYNAYPQGQASYSDTDVWNSILLCQVARFEDRPHLTALVPVLTGIHPDDAFSVIPYEKGQAFLFYLETLLGGPGIL